MALIAKPAEKPKFADTAPGANIATPPGSKQDAGWAVEKPPLQYFNWIHKWTYKWLLWAENRVDNLENAVKNEYDFVVGTGDQCTHATLALLFADAAFVNGSKVLVKENQTVNTTALVLSKTDCEIVFKPGVGLVKGSSSQGLSITGSNNRIKGGKHTGFNGGTDKAIVVDAAVTFGILTEMVFSNNTVNILDNSETCAIFGNNA